MLSELQKNCLAGWLLALFPLFLVAGCGDDTDIDCGYPCPAPFTCIQKEDAAYCASTPGTQISCHGTPADQAVPFGTSDIGDHTLHWAPGGCLRVTYEAGTEQWLSHIKAAAAAWTALSCSELCLTAPEQSEQPIEAFVRVERRIHVRQVPQESLYDYKAVTETSFDNETGRLAGVNILIASLDEDKEGISLLKLFGFALGLDEPDSAIDSVMSEPESDEIRPDDETVACELYGANPYCE